MKLPVSAKVLPLIAVLLMAAAPAYSQDQVHTVILFVRSTPDPARGIHHVFDGAVIEARRVEDGERADIQRADRNGRVIFRLPVGAYRFGPAEGLESRLQGEMILWVKSNLEAHLELSVK